jgi:hypothetical protein
MASVGLLVATTVLTYLGLGTAGAVYFFVCGAIAVTIGNIASYSILRSRQDRG